MILQTHQCEVCKVKCDDVNIYTRWFQVKDWLGYMMEVCAECMFKAGIPVPELH